MNIFKKIYCRTLMVIFYSIKPFLPYHIPKRLERISDIPSLLIEKQKTKVLLVTDKGLRSIGMTLELENQLKENGIDCTVYDKTQPNPTVKNVEDGLALYKEKGCNAIIAFGGGSSMDCAKAVGARVAKPKQSVNKMGGLLRVRGKTPLLIAIPTTAGTGSEATPACVIMDGDIGHKYTINDFCLSPDFSVLDPKVTYTLPPGLTATTGLDAMSHALESFVGRSTTKRTRAISLESIKLVFDNVQIAYANPTDAKARANMLKASYLGGLSMAMSYVGYCHAIAHTLGGTYNLPHGLTISVTLPIVLEAYGKSAYKKLYKVAVHCGIALKSDSKKVATLKFIDRLKKLIKDMNISPTLACIKREDIPTMAKHADKEANPLYAVPKLFNAKELEPLYEKIADWRTEN